MFATLKKYYGTSEAELLDYDDDKARMYLSQISEVGRLLSGKTKEVEDIGKDVIIRVLIARGRKVPDA